MPGRRRQGKKNPTDHTSNNHAASKNHDDETKNLPEWFAACKERRVLEYDTTRFPFRELYADWLGVPHNSLDHLHTLTAVALLSAVLGDHVQLTDAVLEEKVSISFIKCNVKSVTNMPHVQLSNSNPMQYCTGIPKKYLDDDVIFV